MTIGSSDVGAGARRQKHNQLTRETAGKFDSVIEAPVGRYSQKPTAFAEMIETLCPHLPRLEMFAPQHRAGWEVWGNEADWEAVE
jgi:N6-adenosine-specific RNA methylase IME4